MDCQMEPLSPDPNKSLDDAIQDAQNLSHLYGKSLYGQRQEQLAAWLRELKDRREGRA